MHQWNNGLRLKGATVSEEGEDIGQDPQEGPCAGDRKVEG
jgi:hypothetical protein